MKLNLESPSTDPITSIHKLQKESIIGKALTNLVTGSSTRESDSRIWKINLDKSIFLKNYFRREIEEYNQLAAESLLGEFNVGDKLTFLGHNGSWSVLCGLPFSQASGGFSIFKGNSGNILFGFDGNFKIFNYMSLSDLNKWLGNRNILRIIDFRSHRHTDHFGSIGHSYEFGDRLKFINNNRQSGNQVSFHIFAPESVFLSIDTYPYKSYSNLKPKFMIRKDVHEDSSKNELSDPIEIDGVTLQFLEGQSHGPPGKPTGVLIDGSELFLPDVSFTKLKKGKIYLDNNLFKNISEKPIDVFRATSLHFPAIKNDFDRQQHFLSAFIADKILKPNYILTCHISAADLIPFEILKDYIEIKRNGENNDFNTDQFLEMLMKYNDGKTQRSWNFYRVKYIQEDLRSAVLTSGVEPLILKKDGSIKRFKYQEKIYDLTIGKDSTLFQTLIEQILKWYKKNKKSFFNNLGFKV